jgi:hypothetical protein
MDAFAKVGMAQTLLCMHCMGTRPYNANQRAKQISQEIAGLPNFMQTNMQTNRADWRILADNRALPSSKLPMS